MSLSLGFSKAGIGTRHITLVVFGGEVFPSTNLVLILEMHLGHGFMRLR